VSFGPIQPQTEALHSTAWNLARERPLRSYGRYGDLPKWYVTRLFYTACDRGESPEWIERHLHRFCSKHGVRKLKNLRTTTVNA
jgi:hypothetical protein